MGYKLNLASGTDIKDGWVNLDVVPKWSHVARGCDVVWDARKDKIPFADDSVDEIYAGYLLLHLAPHFHVPVLSEIRRVLSPTGSLMIGEVDMEVVLARWLNSPLDARLSELIWGEQGNYHGEEFSQFDKHCHGFTEFSLKHLLDVNGFTDFNRVKIHPHPDVFYELTITCKKK
jgi:SAM-dependent methyltransferase